MSSEVIRRHTRGKGELDRHPAIGIATLVSIPLAASRKDHVRVIRADAAQIEDLAGYAAVLTDLSSDELARKCGMNTQIAVVGSTQHIEHIRDGDVLRLDFQTGFVRSLYRAGSSNNVIFATDRCNSNCVMCSQPPKDIDERRLIDEHLRLIRLIPKDTETLGITGGEPTLMGDDLFRLLAACRDELPKTHLHMLTNGRLFYYRTFAERLAELKHPDLTLGIPLYSDIASKHDCVVQARGAFDETMVGFHNLARYGQRIEIRVVIHRQTYERLPQLAEFIYRNCPFAEHVALMGLEMMGYTKRNLSLLWIDPVEYQEQLAAATQCLAWAGMRVSIYNHQLCVLKRSLWPYARKSISDFKIIYLEQCQACSVLQRCGGLFKSAESIHSKHITPVLENHPPADGVRSGQNSPSL